MTRTLRTNRTLQIAVDELALFMNEGWPGEDWYLDECDEYLWGCAFTEGAGKELYKPCRPGTMVNLYDFDAVVRWQGHGRTQCGRAVVSRGSGGGTCSSAATASATRVPAKNARLSPA